MAKRGAKVRKDADGPVRVSVSLDVKDHADLKVIAKDMRVSLAWVVRDAVSDYLDARNPLFPRKRGGGGP